ncbi:MAG: nitrite reductase [Burkholderiales bacterium]|jgi:nitrite reductase (NO-forming)/hydroxylamine reductase|uniref:Nitrite reductase n=2 Tax=root TaxID=1 RepID=A0A809R778_9PROT|nr:Nitrite reductase [Rhodocyclaceae bacterium]MCZ2173504.1 nitrite reductase [Burkholderiales bacterium]OQY75115.1 MAG: nitrite reductase [Rhodocyclaceae bacterium UTPRO2]BBO20195.1 nitrite reductase [Candidatus Desulfobacillus denitrificans]GIK45981.1 MAG: nitrite reductase [Betaproteobacteria bacterium]
MQKRNSKFGALGLAALPLALAGIFSSAYAQDAAPPAMTAEEKATGKKIYFERCAGCHGVLRKGATGKNLEPSWSKKDKDGKETSGGTLKLGTNRLEKIIALGTEGGMVNYDDILTKEEINIMARYIQNTPDVPPEFSLKDMRDSWKLIIPVKDRPTKQMNKINLNNVFATTLRDTGELALIDGDTKQIWQILKTGYAVHISRLSASGRYVYTVGRDGLVTLIDLWFEKPTTVATIKIGSDARSVDTSKFKGYEDKYLVGGSYWPPQYSIMDGFTLEPLKVVSTRGATVDGEYHPEPRVASIVASHIKPEWVINIKETGMITLVDYSDIKNLKTTTIDSAKFLHDGGWDMTKRYFLVAANASNKIAAVDTKTGKLAALVDTKKIPHPGRGANFVHPEHGPVWATGHLGDAVVTLISTPHDNPKFAKYKSKNWKVVQELPMPGAGNLFVKTHPKSKHLWADMPMNPERENAESMVVFNMNDLTKPPVKIDVAKDSGLPMTKALRRAVHQEFSQDGTEVWVSLWGGKTDQSAIVVYDDKTLKVKKVITDPKMITPTGKFNVYNTVKDIY